MEKFNNRLKLWLTMLLVLPAVLASAQFTTLAIQDFDTIGTPSWGYTLSSGTLQFVNGNSAGTAAPANTPFGIGGSWAWKQEQQSGGVQLTFNNLTTTGYDTVYLSFNLGAFALNGSDAPDVSDYVLFSVSTNNGTNWYDQVRIVGGGTPTTWANTALGEASRVFSTAAYTQFTATGTGLGNVMVKVPNTTNQVRVRITLRSSTANERWTADNVTAKVRGVTINNAGVTGLVSPTDFCPGYHDIKVRIANKGQNIVNSVNLNWSLNGVLQTPIGFYTQLDTVGGTGPKDTVLTLTNMLFNLATTNTIKAWTDYPNGVVDGFPQDDTMSFVLKPSLSGTYTVGGVAPNYPTILAAITDLNTYGVCGPVMFNVAPGTYTSALSLNNIRGASHINTIDFIGANTPTTIITASVNNGSTVLLAESKYVTFSNFTINNTITGNATGFAFAGNTLKCVIKNCVINFPNAYSYTTYGINVTGTLTGYGSSNNFSDSITIDSNTINGAYYGIYFTGNYTTVTTTAHRDFKVRYNTVNNSYYMGIYGDYVFNALDVSGNKINMDSLGDTYSYGIYLYDCENSNPNTYHNISYNSIKNAGGYGIYTYYLLCSSTNPARYFNNSLMGGFRNANAYGIQISDNTTSPALIYHNTVNMDFGQASSGYPALYYYGSNNTKIKNNIFAYTATSGSGLPVTVDNALASGNLNNNLYYNATGGNLIYKNGSTFNSSNYKTLAAGGDKSYNVNPGFAGAKDVHITNGCLRGDTLTTLIPVDIDGQMRSITPLIGVDEVNMTADNIAVDAVTNPKAPLVAGWQDVVVVVRNKGNNPVSSFLVSYVLNNGTPVTQNWSGLLGTCDTVSVVFTGANQGNFTNANNMVAYTSFPNGFNDTQVADDTLKMSLFTPLNGTYTIGSGIADFPNFTAACDALKIGGVSGNVVFNVKTATYNEPISFTSAIVGASDTSSITFQSAANHRDSVVLDYNSIANSAIMLANVNYISFKSMTLQATNINFGRVIEIAGTTSYITVDDCKITGPVSGSYETIYANDINGKNLWFKNNAITNGAFGIYIFANSTTYADSIMVEDNTFTGMNSYGGYFYYTRNLKIRRNTFTGSMSYALRTYYSYDDIEVTRNNINITGTYGIYAYYNNGTPTASALFANNVIRVTGNYGIRNYYGSYQKFYNNTISVTGTYPIYVSYNSASYTNNEWKNNIFHTSGTSATSYAIYIVGNTSATNVFDYNVYYTAGTNALYYTTAYTTFAAYRSAYPNNDKNSWFIAPPFTSTTNLAPNLSNVNTWYLNGRGIQTINNSDINGATRSTTILDGAPDIGAHEFTPTALPPLATALPVTPSAGTTQVFTFLGDTVATILWDALSSVPTTIGVRFYSGEYAPQTSAPHNRTNCYWDIQETGIGFYNYTINLYYKESMKGNITNEADMRLAKMQGVNPWAIYNGGLSSTNTINNILTALGLTNFSVFTGTDNTNPLPVNLLSFTGNIRNNDAILNWQTASERNTAEFVLERSLNTTNFERVTSIRAAKNSNSLKKYNYIDADVFNRNNSAYYRLKMIDVDGKFTYSNVVALNKGTTVSTPTVYPNPFRDNLLLQHAQAGKTVHVFNIAGKQIITIDVKQDGDVTLSELNALTAGIYFVKIDNTTIKVVKE